MTLLRKNGSYALYLIFIFLLISAMVWLGVSVQDKTGYEDNNWDKQKQDHIASNLNDTPNKWTLSFSENPSIISDFAAVGNLEFLQIDRDVFGYGTLNIGKKTLKVTIAGSFDSDVLNLYLVTPEGSMMHKLSILLKGTSLSGDYTNYTSSSMKRTGTISGNVIKDSKGAGLGLTPSKEITIKIDDDADMENLITELNSEVPDSGKTNNDGNVNHN